MTIAMAKELAEAVEKAATILGVKVVVAIRDEGANLVLLHAMDDSYIASVQASQDKAYTAVALKMPTHIALDESRGGSLDGLTNGNGILLLGGGYPLRTDKKIYGGIGVSGGTKEQDTTLAMVADAYFKSPICLRRLEKLMVDEKQVSEIVKNVIAGMDISSFDNKPARKQLGVFDTMEEAIAACNKAYTTFRHYNKEQRENIIKEIRTSYS